MSARAVQFGVVLLASSTARPPVADRDPSAAQIDACRRGDRTALDEVFRLHADGLERLLARLVGPRADVEDLLQETFSAAISAFPKFRGEAAVRTWLHRIAINIASKHFRQPRHRRDVPVEDEHEPRSAVATPEEDAQRRRLARRLYHHLDKLDAPKRIAFLLVVVEELSIAEVAALTGVSKAATKSRVFWARRTLQRKLARDPEFSEDRS